MAKHRASGDSGKHRAGTPKPGDPGWTHPDVKGETDPHKIKAQLDAIEAQEQAERDRIKGTTQTGDTP